MFTFQNYCVSFNWKNTFFFKGIEGIDASPVDDDDQNLVSTLKAVMEDMAKGIFSPSQASKTSKPTAKTTAKSSPRTTTKKSTSQTTAKKAVQKTTKKTKKAQTSSSEEEEDEYEYTSEDEEESEEYEGEGDEDDVEEETDGEHDGSKKKNELPPEILKKLRMFDHVPPFGNPADYKKATEKEAKTSTKGA